MYRERFFDSYNINLGNSIFIPVKLYYPTSHYNKHYRGLVFPLLKPFIKGENFTDAQRKLMYGVSEIDFDFTNVLEEADVAILPMAWNYYIKTHQTEKALAFVKKCQGLNKEVMVYNAGDFGVQVPHIENLCIFRQSGYKSRFSKNEQSLPAFISDPLKKYFKNDQVFQRQYTPKPIIGFCGQANASFFNAIQEKLRTILRNIKSFVGLSKAEPQKILSTSYLRASVLKRLEASQEVKTNFILRKKYRAGVTTDKDVHKSTLEFYDNLKDSDYVVCIRGAGNFSVRFYETLAMGRIPVFINTDCSLPLNEVISWKKHVVWVEYNERHLIVQKVNEFHSALSSKCFTDLQHANRVLWNEKLTLGRFFHYVMKTNAKIKFEK